MAVKVVHVSDISGKEADEQSLGRLVVHEHPEYADLPVTLEVLPRRSRRSRARAASSPSSGSLPAPHKGERMVVSLDDFNLLAGAGVMESAVQDALIAKHRNRPRSVAGGGSGVGRPLGSGSKVNHALEHAVSPTAAASPRPRRSWSARTWTRSTGASASRPARDRPSDQAMRDRYPGSSSTAPASRSAASRQAGRSTGRAQFLVAGGRSGKTPRPGRPRSCTVVRDRGKVRLKGSTSYTAWAVNRALRTTTLASTCSCPWTADRGGDHRVPVLVGTSGWQYRDWRGRLYPARLARPAERTLHRPLRHR